MKYVLMFACFAFGAAHADRSCICENNRGDPLFEGYPRKWVPEPEIKLKTRGKSIHFENDQFEGHCVAVESKITLIENKIEDTFDCKGNFRLKKNNETFEETFYLDRFFFYTHDCGNLYRISNDIVHHFSCHEG